jgi:hypothetical protein
MRACSLPMILLRSGNSYDLHVDGRVRIRARQSTGDWSIVVARISRSIYSVNWSTWCWFALSVCLRISCAFHTVKPCVYFTELRLPADAVRYTASFDVLFHWCRKSRYGMEMPDSVGYSYYIGVLRRRLFTASAAQYINSKND